MAIRNISVKVTANVAQYTNAMNKAARATKNFSKATNSTGAIQKTSRSMDRMSASTQKAAGSMHMFKRAVGGGLTREMGHTSAVAHRSNKIFNAMAQQTGLLSKSFAALKVATLATTSAFAGFIFINSAIQTVKKFFDVTIGGFTDFNKKMTETMAIIPDVGGQIEESFTNMAFSVAKITKFSPDEIAEGFYFLASSGFTAEQSLRSVEQVARFAQAGLMDLAEATEMVTDVTAALGLADKFNPKETEEGVKRTSDVMVEAARTANATVEEFGQAFTNKFANMLSITNKTVEEGAAVLAVMANQGVKGQIAGTRATMALRDLQRAAIKNEAEFQKMGVTVFDSNGTLMNMSDIIGSLEGALLGLSDKEQKAALQMLGFQDRSVQALLTLIGFSDQIADYEQVMKSAGGATEEVSEKQMKSLSNRMNVAVSVIKSFSAEVGTKFIKGIEKVVNAVAPAFGSIIENIQDIAKSAGTFITPLMKAFGGAAFAGIVAFAKSLEIAFNVLNKFRGVLIAVGAAMAARAGIQMLGVRFQALAVKSATARTGLLSYRIALQMGTSQTRAFGLSLASMGQHLQRTTFNMAAFKKAAIGMKGGLMGTSAAAVGFSTALMAGVMMMDSWANSAQNAKNAASKLNEELGSDNSSVDAIFDRINARQKEMNDAADTSDNITVLGGTLEWLSPWTENTKIEADKLRLELAELNEADLKLVNNFLANSEKIKNKTGATDREITRMAKTIGVDLTTAGSMAEQSIATVVGALEKEQAALNDAGISTEDFANKTDEEMQEMADAAKKMSEDIQKAFDDLFGLGGAISEAADLADIYYGILTPPEDVFSDMKSEAEEAAKDTAKASAEAFNDGIKDQTDALTKAKEDIDDKYEKILDKAKKRDKDALKDRKDAEKEAIDDQIDNLNDAKKDQEDFYKEPTMGLDSVLESLKASTEESLAFSRALLELSDSNADTAVVEMFRNMGEEGLPFVEELVNGSKDKIKEFNEWMAKQEELQKEISTKTLRESIDERKKDAAKFQGDAAFLVGNISADSLNLPEGKSVSDVLAKLVSMGPEGIALIHEMAEELRVGLAEGSVESKEKIEDLLTDVWQHDDFMGILDGFKSTMDAVEQFAALSAEQVMNTLSGSFEDFPADLAAMLAELQFMMGGAPLMIGGREIDFIAMQENRKQAASSSNVDQSLVAGAHANAYAAEQRATAGSPGGPVAEAHAAAYEAEQYLAGINVMKQYTPWWVTGIGSRNKDGPFIPPGVPSGVQYLDRDNKKTRVSGQYAMGGIHRGQIARGGGIRIWNEPETGGEAYIPLARSKRARSEMILKQVASEFGYGMMKYANGGIAPGTGMVGGGRYGTPAAQSQVIVVPMTAKNETNFNGPIQGVDMNDAVRFAERKKRQSRLGS